jgi:hypothetical protein
VHDRRPIPTRPSRGVAFLCLAGVLVSLGSLSGCYKPLFPEDAPRTQFENYDRMRQRLTPLEEPDVFGALQPALRARLTPPQ